MYSVYHNYTDPDHEKLRGIFLSSSKRREYKSCCYIQDFRQSIKVETFDNIFNRKQARIKMPEHPCCPCEKDWCPECLVMWDECQCGNPQRSEGPL